MNNAHARKRSIHGACAVDSTAHRTCALTARRSLHGLFISWSISDRSCLLFDVKQWRTRPARCRVFLCQLSRLSAVKRMLLLSLPASEVYLPNLWQSTTQGAWSSPKTHLTENILQVLGKYQSISIVTLTAKTISFYKDVLPLLTNKYEAQ